ncbi:hypothetical protein MMSR116_06070 [Methylobacterium mesophilicum SR1.6/6]|uniref:Uncharacterized protein n=1 Tax=Methylobacterium mesophilicum SR1.6/6 TaxID=908290 RepID=A0A6B9FKS3_9HYPH|nr:hypothetical protein [Methylobacterium mesophilicum]QGY01518.1 hypothetical protein MMSR116_06070 [Methylobacterium mesophilicum SR1.6/6]
MAASKASTSPEPACLYPDEAEIARAVLGPGRAKCWPSLAVVLERSGFPKVDVMMGGRYWPAVKAFLDRRHHVGEHAPARPIRRGEEGLDARGQRSVRARS